MNTRLPSFNRRLLTSLTPAFALIASVSLAEAKTLRWASQGDVLTFDPHAFNGGVSNAFASYVYDALVHYDVDFNIEPGLATQWIQPDPNTWRFTLRSGVRFHDGTPFNADDVVFSMERALAPTSGFKVYLAGVNGVRKIDDLTVELSLAGPNPMLLRQLTGVRIVSKVRAIKNRVEKPQNFAQKAARHGRPQIGFESMPFRHFCDVKPRERRGRYRGYELASAGIRLALVHVAAAT